jgi:hypothetical protein
VLAVGEDLRLQRQERTPRTTLMSTAVIKS